MSKRLRFRVREFNLVCEHNAQGQLTPIALESLDGEAVPAHRAMHVWRAKSEGSALQRALHEAQVAGVAPTDESSHASNDSTADDGTTPTNAAHEAQAGTVDGSTSTDGVVDRPEAVGETAKNRTRGKGKRPRRETAKKVEP